LERISVVADGAAHSASLDGQDLLEVGHHATIGTRIPKDYFVTAGRGESDITVHAGSYHLALRHAGIEMCNIITYSSILPACATEVDRPDELVHGSVLETIMAVATARKGRRATAGIIWGWLYRHRDGRKHGGLVCEYNGSLTEGRAERQLRASLDELYENGYSDDYDLDGVTLLMDSFVPQKKHGTSVVSLCFLNHYVPLLDA